MSPDPGQGYGWSNAQESDLNRLNRVQIKRLSVSAEEAEVWFQVHAQRIVRGTEVRGRIVGPRCLIAETAESVIPLRSVVHRGGDQAELIARAAFPAPGFWDPRNPLLYRVVVELWQDGQRCTSSGFDMGFRTIEVRSGNVLVNQKQLSLKGTSHLPQSREETAARRQSGYNLVLAGKAQWNWWVRANPMGFLLLEKVALSTLTPQYVGLLGQQPCFFGFLLGRELLDHPPSESERFLRSWQERGVLIGLELDGPPPPSLPGGLSFLVCTESELPVLSTIPLPKLALRNQGISREGEPGAAVPGVLGWIDQ
jgi:Glycosyl hydrolases family 2